VEDTWIGRQVLVGTAVLRVTATSPRCVMIDMETADLPEQHGNLTAIGRLNDVCLGVIASVESPGRISVGDTVVVR
jgi:MOSC domain-containing protein YiiM